MDLYLLMYLGQAFPPTFGKQICSLRSDSCIFIQYSNSEEAFSEFCRSLVHIHGAHVWHAKLCVVHQYGHHMRPQYKQQWNHVPIHPICPSAALAVT